MLVEYLFDLIMLGMAFIATGLVFLCQVVVERRQDDHAEDFRRWTVELAEK